MFKGYSLNKLLILFTVAGFVFLTADSILEHWTILKQDLPAYIPILWSVLGGGVAILSVKFWNEQWIRRLHVFLLATFVVAAAGLYFHIAEDEDEEQMTAEQREHESKEKDKPLLAPLAFAGLAAAGLLGTSRRWHAEVKEITMV